MEIEAPPILPKGETLRAKHSPSSLKGCPPKADGVVVFLVVLLFLSFQSIAQVDLIPKPWFYLQEGGEFVIDGNTKVYYHWFYKESALLLQRDLKELLDADLEIKEVEKGIDEPTMGIYIDHNPSAANGGQYAVEVSDQRILIQSSTSQGHSFGIQTLKQLIGLKGSKIPACFIQDGPRFPHRGLLLDCSRHFFSVETVKRYIDLLAFYKMNVLHWHLTEDQGWRIQIDKYPKLTEVGAWRTEKDGSRYGGFYTKEEIREVVAFAAARGVTVIPEIEMPGHSQAALAAHSEFSCTGDTAIKVANDWGVFKEIYCAGNDSVFVFLEDVLTEVMELFPSKYIHIGGDEAPKFRWEHCAKCQKRIADEGLKDEHELQSYFITRIEKFLNENGRQLIGWDEILEGGLSPNVTVQSWRGMEHGKHAAEMKHNVVMSPTSHCYLDYGLDAIDLERVYRFNPIPEGLEKEFEQYILGGEVNMWTEHVPNDSVLDSKVFPRLIAAAEVFWSGSGGDYKDFYNRLQSHYPILEKMGVQYGLEAEPVRVYTFLKYGKTFVKIEPGLPDLTIKYSPGDDLAHSYKEPFELNRTMNLDVMAYKNGSLYGQIYQTELVHHLALGKTDSVNAFSPYYTAGGNNGLTDGLTGSLNFRDGRWMGFSGNDAVVEIDLGKDEMISTVKINFYEYGNAWIMPPKKVTVLTSIDGDNWSELYSTFFEENEDGSEQTIHEFKYNSAGMHTVRYVKVSAQNYGPLPDWHDAAGSDAWIFVDEIIVR